MLLLAGCLTSQQHASVSQGRICPDNLTCCHTEMEAADQTFHLIQSQYTDTGPTSPSADPITPGAWQGSHWSANFLSHWYDSTPNKIPAQAGFEPGIFRSRGGRLTTRPTRRFVINKQTYEPTNLTNKQTTAATTKKPGQKQHQPQHMRQTL